jgi:hypothetical protein
MNLNINIPEINNNNKPKIKYNVEGSPNKTNPKLVKTKIKTINKTTK